MKPLKGRGKENGKRKRKGKGKEDRVTSIFFSPKRLVVQSINEPK